MNTNLHPGMVQALKGFMPVRKRHSADFDTTISGIPCGIQINSVDVHQGNFSWNAACPEEYHGYTDIEFTVLDSKGYLATWLANKLTSDDTARIESEILESLKEQA